MGMTREDYWERYGDEPWLDDELPKCPECEGEKMVWDTFTNDDGDEDERRVECPLCDGIGYDRDA